MTCDGFCVPHFGQAWSCLGFKASWERRMPVREFDCLRLGTAMGETCRKCLVLKGLENSSAYAVEATSVKSGRKQWPNGRIYRGAWQFIAGLKII